MHQSFPPSPAVADERILAASRFGRKLFPSLRATSSNVIAAHDRSVELFPQQTSRRAHYSLLSIMVLYTMIGVALLVGS